MSFGQTIFQRRMVQSAADTDRKRQQLVEDRDYDRRMQELALRTIIAEGDSKKSDFWQQMQMAQMMGKASATPGSTYKPQTADPRMQESIALGAGMGERENYLSGAKLALERERQASINARDLANRNARGDIFAGKASLQQEKQSIDQQLADLKAEGLQDPTGGTLAKNRAVIDYLNRRSAHVGAQTREARHKAAYEFADNQRAIAKSLQPHIAAPFLAKSDRVLQILMQADEGVITDEMADAELKRMGVGPAMTVSAPEDENSGFFFGD